MSENDEHFEGEAPCRPGGNYGLCGTHPTCEMVHERLKAAEAQVAELKQTLAWVGCAFCGLKMPSEGAPLCMAEHILVCELHPLRAAVQENVRLRNLCRELEAARDERDASRRDLEEIGRMLGCNHTEDGLARCVRDLLNKVSG